MGASTAPSRRVHYPMGEDPRRSEAARVGARARAAKLSPERRREIGRLSNTAGLAALAPIHAEARARWEEYARHLANQIADAAARGKAFHVRSYITANDGPHEGRVRARFKQLYGKTCDAYYWEQYARHLANRIANAAAAGEKFRVMSHIATDDGACARRVRAHFRQFYGMNCSAYYRACVAARDSR